MTDTNEDEEETDQSESPYPQTRLTLIQRAKSTDEEESMGALDEFFHSYWSPLYSFLRQLNESEEDAQDLVQGFIGKNLVAGRLLEKWNPEKGKLRTFLLTALKNFRTSEYRKDGAQKRGGHDIMVSIDEEEAEKRYQNLPFQDSTAEEVFDQEWCRVVVDEVFQLVSQEYAARGKEEEFRLLLKNLRGQHLGETRVDFDAIAGILGTNSNNVKQKMFQFKKCLRLHLHEVVSNTVPAADVEDEIVNLAGYISR